MLTSIFPSRFFSKPSLIQHITHTAILLVGYYQRYEVDCDGHRLEISQKKCLTNVFT